MKGLRNIELTLKIQLFIPMRGYEVEKSACDDNEDAGYSSP